MSQKGQKYEHDLADEIVEATDGELLPLGAGYTSRHASPADLIIDDGEAVHVLEIKNTSTDAYTFHWEPDDYQKDDLYNMMKFCVNYPRPAYPYWAVNFNNRQLAIGKLYINDFPDTDAVLDSAVSLSPIEAKRTRADNLRVYKPESDDWTTKHIDDAQAVLDAIGYII